MNDYAEVNPPILESLGGAPRSVCARWMGDYPCGGAATWHVTWDMEMHNGPVCDSHMAEARSRWVFIGAHPYGPVCGRRGSHWLPQEDVCFMPAEGEATARPPRSPCAAATSPATRTLSPTARTATSTPRRPTGTWTGPSGPGG